MESKTIRELAEELGVSKTAIRKHMSDEFRANYTENPDGNTILISPAGCKLLVESLRKPANQFAETPENPVSDEIIDLLRATIDSLRATATALESQLAEKDRQLARKDEQLAEKDEQIRALNEHVKQANQNVDQAQRLHAAAMLPAPKKTWKEKWAEKKAGKQAAANDESL